MLTAHADHHAANTHADGSQRISRSGRLVGVASQRLKTAVMGLEEDVARLNKEATTAAELLLSHDSIKSPMGGKS